MDVVLGLGLGLV